MTAVARLEALVGPNLAAAILDALREEFAATATAHAEPATRWLTVEQTAEYLGTTAKASTNRPRTAPNRARRPPPLRRPTGARRSSRTEPLRDQTRRL